jgi:hypothetical protein
MASDASVASLFVRHELVLMDLETLSRDEKNAYADKWLATLNPETAWAAPMREAIERWRVTEHPPVALIKLFAVRFGPIIMVTCNGEVFSRFATDLRESTGEPLFAVTYASAAFGYIPTRAAYAEGGYEVDTAHFFYNSLRPRIGSLEMLIDRAAELIQGMSQDDVA